MKEKKSDPGPHGRVSEPGRQPCPLQMTHLSPKLLADSPDSPSVTAVVFPVRGVSNEWDRLPRQKRRHPGKVNGGTQGICL